MSRCRRPRPGSACSRVYEVTSVEQSQQQMRALTFGPHGEGDIVYLILEDHRRVDILVVVWLK